MSASSDYVLWRLLSLPSPHLRATKAGSNGHGQVKVPQIIIGGSNLAMCAFPLSEMLNLLGPFSVPFYLYELPISGC